MMIAQQQQLKRWGQCRRRCWWPNCDSKQSNRYFQSEIPLVWKRLSSSLYWREQGPQPISQFKKQVLHYNCNNLYRTWHLRQNCYADILLSIQFTYFFKMQMRERKLLRRQKKLEIWRVEKNDTGRPSFDVTEAHLTWIFFHFYRVGTQHFLRDTCGKG